MRSIVQNMSGIGARAAICLLLGGCQLLDWASIEPRSYQVNLGSQNVREELILLNVVRASRFEPMNFTALSKYTASGSLSATGSNNIGIDFVRAKGGVAGNVGASPQTTLGASGSQGNSFDLVPLDNSDFYQNFLATLPPKFINILVNAGLSREVVFYSLIDSIDVNLTAAGVSRVGFIKLRFRNDPTNDTWNGESDPKLAFERCREEAEADYHQSRPNGRWAPFLTPFWYAKTRMNDCHYHKFLLLIQQAFRYGVTTAAVPRLPSGQKSSTTVSLPKPQTAATPRKAGAAGQHSTQGHSADGGSINITINAASNQNASSNSISNQIQDVILCFDPAIAAHYGIVLRGPSICPVAGATTTETLLSQPLKTNLGPYDDSMEPVLRSAYGVFQYYGKLLRTQTQVEISEESGRNTRDYELFKITPDIAGCFVRVTYEARTYCVPEADAGNTKEVLTLLIALVNLSTVRSSLPATQSVLLNPQ